MIKVELTISFNDTAYPLNLDENTTITDFRNQLSKLLGKHWRELRPVFFHHGQRCTPLYHNDLGDEVLIHFLKGFIKLESLRLISTIRCDSKLEECYQFDVTVNRHLASAYNRPSYEKIQRFMDLKSVLETKIAEKTSNTGLNALCAQMGPVSPEMSNHYQTMFAPPEKSTNEGVYNSPHRLFAGVAKSLTEVIHKFTPSELDHQSIQSNVPAERIKKSTTMR